MLYTHTQDRPQNLLNEPHYNQNICKRMFLIQLNVELLWWAADRWRPHRPPVGVWNPSWWRLACGQRSVTFPTPATKFCNDGKLSLYLTNNKHFDAAWILLKFKFEYYISHTHVQFSIQIRKLKLMSQAVP